MNLPRFVAALLVALALGTIGRAQDQIGCPDMVVEMHPGMARPGGQLDCPGARISVSGLTIDTRAGNCPAYAWLVPPHHQPVARDGSNTYVVADSTVLIQLLTFRCRTEYWFCLIPVGAGCDVGGVTNAGRIHTYSVHACALLPQGGA